MLELSLPETDASGALLEYRLTAMVLALVSTINGAGRHVALEFEPTLEKSQSPRRRILNAFANIAARGPEVIAVTTPDSSDDGGSFSPATHIVEVLAMDEENDSMGSSSFCDTTVMTNTEWKDPKRERWLTKIETGKSKWADIMDSPWCCVPNST